MATLAAGEGLGGRSLNHIVDAVVEKGLEGWAFSPGSGNALMIDEKTVAACFPEKPGRPRKIFGFAVQPDGDRLGVKRIAPPKKDSAAEDGRAKCFARREFGFAPPQPSDRVAAKVACVMMQR